MRGPQGIDSKVPEFNQAAKQPQMLQDEKKRDSAHPLKERRRGNKDIYVARNFVQLPVPLRQNPRAPGAPTA